MNSTQLKRQKFAGYALPMLLGWFLFLWLRVITYWDFTSNNSRVSLSKSQIQLSVWLIPIALCWLVLMPLSGFVMGILNAYCWKNQIWFNPDKEFKAHLQLFLIFWGLSLVGMLVVNAEVISFENIFMCFYGALWVFPLHFTCFRRGQEIGKKWIETDAISRFMGRKNEWERNESE